MQSLLARGRRSGLLTVLFLALAVGGPDTAVGQQTAPIAPERLAAARELIEVSGAAKQFDDVLPRVLGQMQQMITRRNSADGRLVREIFDRVGGRMLRDKADLLDEIARFYAERLTVEEMGDITRFYQSPTGAKLLSLTPDLAQRTLEITQAWVGKLTGEMQQEVEAERKRRREEEAGKEKRAAPK